MSYYEGSKDSLLLKGCLTFKLFETFEGFVTALIHTELHHGLLQIAISYSKS